MAMAVLCDISPQRAFEQCPTTLGKLRSRKCLNTCGVTSFKAVKMARSLLLASAMQKNTFGGIKVGGSELFQIRRLDVQFLERPNRATEWYFSRTHTRVCVSRCHNYRILVRKLRLLPISHEYKRSPVERMGVLGVLHEGLLSLT